MPVHENEHAGESVQRGPHHGTGDRAAGINSQARRIADSTNARAKQVIRGLLCVIPNGAEEWSEWAERHRRQSREGSGERVGRRMSSISYYFLAGNILRCLPSAVGLDMT